VPYDWLAVSVSIPAAWNTYEEGELYKYLALLLRFQVSSSFQFQSSKHSTPHQTKPEPSIISSKLVFSLSIQPQHHSQRFASKSAMATKKVLVVFGATGVQGGSVVKAILGDSKLKESWTVRGITRDTSKPSAKALEAQGAETVAVSLHGNIPLESIQY